MPEMTMVVRWPDGQVQECYSPSLVLHDHLEAGASYPVADFVSRTVYALGIASDRVREKFGFACTSAAATASQVRAVAARHPDDALVDAVTEAIDPDWLQLHGAESPERVALLRARTGRPVMKALGVASDADLALAREFADVCDWLLFDAKPPKDSILPGGNGVAFDWTLLTGRRWSKPWMLSGGLTPENVAAAVAASGATAVDVSSGVEDAPGKKSPARITKFLETVRSL